MSERERIIKVNIEEEMKSAYIDYSMSVIVSRALPDVRDGLKAGPSQGSLSECQNWEYFQTNHIKNQQE